MFGALGVGSEMAHIDRVELPVAQPRRELDRRREVARQVEPVVDDRRRTGRDLVIVEDGEDVLGVAPIDSATLAVDDPGVDEVRPAVDAAIRRELAGGADLVAAGAGDELEPDLVRVGGPLGEVVANGERAHDHLDQIARSRLERRQRGPQRSMEPPLEVTAFAQAEEVDPHRTCEKLAAPPDRIVAHLDQRGDSGVGRGEAVVVKRQGAAAVEVARAELRRRLERHVAGGAAIERLRRVVEARRGMPRDAGETKGVVVVLPAQEAVAVELRRQVYFVAAAAELGRAVKRLEKRRAVELGPGADQLAARPGEGAARREGERVVARRLDHEVGVAAHRGDLRDGVAGDAGEPGPGGRIVLDIETGIVEHAGEQRHEVVAPRAPARGFEVAVAREDDPPRLEHREAIRGVVERAEAVGALRPGPVGLLVALLAITLEHQGAGLEIDPARRADQGWEEGRPLGRLVRALRRGRGRGVRDPDQRREGRGGTDPAPHALSIEAPPAAAVGHVERRGGDRQDQVSGPERPPQLRIRELDHAFEPQQGDAGAGHSGERAHQDETQPDRPVVPRPPRPQAVPEREQQARHDQRQAEEEVEQEHRERDAVLEQLPGRRLERVDDAEVEGVGHERRAGDGEPPKQPSLDRGQHPLEWSAGRTRRGARRTSRSPARPSADSPTAPAQGPPGTNRPLPARIGKILTYGKTASRSGRTSTPGRPPEAARGRRAACAQDRERGPAARQLALLMLVLMGSDQTDSVRNHVRIRGGERTMTPSRVARWAFVALVIFAIAAPTLAAVDKSRPQRPTTVFQQIEEADKGTGTAPGGGGSDCCFNNGTPGCDDPTCEALICGADSFCCNVSWDQICADAAVAQCAVCQVGAPANDTCDAAIPVAVPSTTAGTTTGATIDNTFPACGTSITSPGVWYEMVGTGNVLTADTCSGTTYDSKLTVFCQDCATPTCISGNDDACGLQSQVTWDSELGATYRVLVHGFGGQSGPFDLTVTDTGVPSTNPVACLALGACCDPTSGGCTQTDELLCTLAGGSFAEGFPCFLPVAGQSYASNPGLAIPDNTPAGVFDTITVSDDFAIGSVAVDVGITHTWIGDLRITLEHVDSSSVVNMWELACGNTDNLNTTFIDGGLTINCAEVTTPGGQVDPLNPGLGPAFTSLAGLSSASDWRLTVSDNAGLDTGTLNTWALNFLQPVCYAYPPVQEIPTMDRRGLAALALLLAGAAAFLLWRRRG